MPITLTEAAATEIKRIVTEQNLPGEQTKLRVGLKGGGCSGFSYTLDLVEEPATEQDTEVEAHGVKILCNERAYQYLDGVEIDYKQDLMQAGFVFKNPNATSSCGCGSSFSV